MDESSSLFGPTDPPRFNLVHLDGQKVSIRKPGRSVKHGTMADQSDEQRSAYDTAFGAGYRAALDALFAKKASVQDIYFSAGFHAAEAKATGGVWSSQHAGLAKGAKWAAYRFHRGEADGTESMLPGEMENPEPIVNPSDAQIARVLTRLASRDWEQIKSFCMELNEGVAGYEVMTEHQSGLIGALIDFFYKNGLAFNFDIESWHRFGDQPTVDWEKAHEAVEVASVEDVMRLVTLWLRCHHWGYEPFDKAWKSGLLDIALCRILTWKEPMGTDFRRAST